MNEGRGGYGSAQTQMLQRQSQLQQEALFDMYGSPQHWGTNRSKVQPVYDAVALGASDPQAYNRLFADGAMNPPAAPKALGVFPGIGGVGGFGGGGKPDTSFGTPGTESGIPSVNKPKPKPSAGGRGAGGLNNTVKVLFG